MNTSKNAKSKGGKEEHHLEPFEMCSSSLHTAIVLLKSSEPGVLFKTFDAITKYIRQYEKNIITLDKLGVVPFALVHIENPDIRIKRMALRFIAFMTINDDVVSEILESTSGSVKKLAIILSKAEDVFVLEFCSLCLARLTTDEKGCNQLMELNVLNVLFKRMKEYPDPDVQMNCLQVIDHLLKTATTSAVTKNPFFDWLVILLLAQSKYIQLQDTALRMTLDLLIRYDDVVVQKKFKDCFGLLELLKIFKNYYFRDVHHKVLNIFSHYVLAETNVYHFTEMGCLQEIVHYLKICKPDIKPHLLGMMEAMTRTWLGKHVMYDLQMDMIFCEHVHEVLHLDTLTKAINGISNMCLLIVSSIRMFNAGIVPLLCQLVGDDTVPWFPTRIGVLRVLKELSRIIREVAANLVVDDAFSSLRFIIRSYLTYPPEAQHLAMECFINLLNFYIQHGAMKNRQFMEEIITIVQSLDTVLRSKMCKLISSLARDDIGKQLFSVTKGEQIITDLLKNGDRRNQSALCALIASTCSESTVQGYHALGTLEYMWNYTDRRDTVPNWEMALQKLLDYHLSLKLALTGSLGISDITKDGFYVVRRYGRTFPTLKTLLEQKAPYHKVAYYVCGFHTQNEDPYKEILGMISEDELKSYLTSRSLHKLSASQLNVDTNLKFYLCKLQRWFGEPGESLYLMDIGDSYETKYRPKCNEISTSIKHKAEILADFVVTQMSAMVSEDENDCSMASVDLHLADLMIDHKTPVIKLGLIRLGGQFERAVLYKVLADRVGIPCTITRTHGHAWCEVAVPEPDDESETIQIYPADKLRPNYVVNLYNNMDVRLHHKDSGEALKVTGPPDAPKYTIAKSEM